MTKETTHIADIIQMFIVQLLNN